MSKTISADNAANAKRILIINVTRIGDTLLNTPAFRAIAKHFPRASITCLGHAKRVEALQNIAYINTIGRIDKKSAIWRGWPALLTGKKFDWAFVWGDDAAWHRYALKAAKPIVARRWH